MPVPRTFLALTGAGFRRYATYRQAMLAGAFTNTVFGFLRCYVLLSVADAAGGSVGGYDAAQLAAYVWLGQGMLAVVDMWTTLEVAERIRTGDVVSDLLRPIDPLWTYLATDLGRAAFALLTRFTLPMAAGALVFDLRLPSGPGDVAAFACSLLLAVVIGFACRWLLALTGYWLHDVRGAMLAWGVVSNFATGLMFPLTVLPGWLYDVLWFTPFPWLLQGPVDVAIGFGDPLAVLAGQLAWVAGLLLACRALGRRAERRLVVQGG